MLLGVHMRQWRAQVAGIARVALVDGMGGRSDKTADRCRDLALVLCADCVSRAANVGVDDGERLLNLLDVAVHRRR